MAHQLSNAPSDGTIYGQTVSDKIGFWGTTAVVRPSVSASATNSAGSIVAILAVISALGTMGLLTLT
jgi:hypothetical protein